MIEVIFSNETHHRLPRKFLESWVKLSLKTIKKLEPKHCGRLETAQQVSLAFLEPSKVKSLNKTYRNKNMETDVLSFGSDFPGDMGDLVLNYNYVRKKAEDLNFPVRVYLGFLVLHGLLHLLGYDHEVSKREERRMYDLQNKVFRKVAKKLAPTYMKSFDI